jgi:hypothetical protein
MLRPIVCEKDKEALVFTAVSRLLATGRDWE